ncbi:MAG TPA: IclR family transcriptional regulator [Beijerinckiaceae bacterium]|nr:IclR family transcriptional regulator [Beijerinckiaceae bacterium]
MTDRYLVPGLQRGIDVLQAFTPERQRLSLGELAAAVGVSKSAVYRVTYTLCQCGLLLQDSHDKSFTLGPAVLRLGYGYLAAREIVEVAMPHLELLRDETGWSAHLGVLEGMDVLYLMRVPARRGAASIVHVGSRLPAHATAMGRILLAHQPEADLKARYVGDTQQRPDARTLPALAAIQRQAAEDRARGHVAHAGTFERSTASIAAGVHDVTGRVVAAINLAGAMSDAGDAIPDAVRMHLLAAAERISTVLGHKPG